jgi:TRAP-type C4-dicarboxylate transport system permease small subunit
MNPLIRRLLNLLGTLAMANIVAMVLITVVDVIGRYFLNSPIPGASEIIEFLLAILVFSALPLATVRHEHIVIDLLDFAVQGRRKQMQQVMVHLVSAISLAFIGWRLWVRAAELGAFADVTQFLKLPLAPLAYSMSVMSWVTAVLMMVLFAAALRGELDPVRTGES